MSVALDHGFLQSGKYNLKGTEGLNFNPSVPFFKGYLP